MFGPGYEDHWHTVPGTRGLELSGDLRFRGVTGVRRIRHDHNGRPYVKAGGLARLAPDGQLRPRRVMLHRAVMSVVLGRELARGEMVCHHDDDRRNNYPSNLYLGDPGSNAADAVRNGRRPVGEHHPQAKLSDRQVREIRASLSRGEVGRDLARVYGVHKSLISRIKHGVRRRALELGE